MPMPTDAPTPDQAPVANGTATGYQTGDAAFKKGRPTEAPGAGPATRVRKAEWRAALDDAADEQREQQGG